MNSPMLFVFFLGLLCGFALGLVTSSSRYRRLDRSTIMEKAKELLVEYLARTGR